MSSNNLIYNRQFGFQENNSTEHAILQFTQDIVGSIEKGEYTLGVFIDLSKAFDTVNHDILLKKLKNYGIRNNHLEILASYLKNRKQYVFHNIHHHDFLPITCGVPQGSILGPLLFIIYVNDFHNSSKLLTEVMFADDTNLFMSNKNVNKLFSDMNRELIKVSKWFKTNKLSLNANKTKWCLFYSSSKKRSLPDKLTDLWIDNILIERKTNIRFLGVLIDENLSWKHHIKNVRSKVFKSIGILYRTRDFIDKRNLYKLYYAFIHSYLNYGCMAWASTNRTKLKSLFSAQKHALRVINFKDRFSDTHQLFLNIRALSIYKLNIFNILCLVF